jgi:DNA polymerase III delta prime subunit
MQIPPKIQTWIDRGIMPHRILLSGPGENFLLALEIASQLQKVSVETLRNGLHGDTLVFADKGKSFKTKYSEQAKKDEQSEQENASGVINWANKKPAAPYRIIILENLERANREAINKLLKLIEEPPIKTIFLFSTRNHFKLLDTIISRVTVVPVLSSLNKSIDKTEAINFLTGINLIKKFKFVEALDKETKNNPQKKINRQVVFDFLEQCLCVAREDTRLHPHLELIYETYRSIEMNLSIRFTLERLVLKLAK